MIAAALVAIATTAMPAARPRPAPPATQARRTAPRRAAPRPPELLHVVGIDLADEQGTTFRLRDAAGVRLEPVTVPTTVCAKDRLGRVLPGNDVQMTVDERKATDGTVVRSVTPTRFTPWCGR